jgi:tetratricopeptide (TPR) repeat protein
MSVRLLLPLIVVLAWLAAPAFGAEKDPRKFQAQKDCLSGKTDSGVALLAELYAETRNPNFVYNQARCYEQAARPEDALNRFREYLRVAKNISAADRADAEKHMEECRALAAEQERAREKKAAAAAVAPPPQPTATAAPEPMPVPRPETANVEASQPAGLDLTAQPQTTASTPIHRKWWFWTGVVAVVGGGVTAYLLATRPSTERFCSRVDITCVATR